MSSPQPIIYLNPIADPPLSLSSMGQTIHGRHEEPQVFHKLRALITQAINERHDQNLPRSSEGPNNNNDIPKAQHFTNFATSLDTHDSFTRSIIGILVSELQDRTIREQRRQVHKRAIQARYPHMHNNPYFCLECGTVSSEERVGIDGSCSRCLDEKKRISAGTKSKLQLLALTPTLPPRTYAIRATPGIAQRSSVDLLASLFEDRTGEPLVTVSRADEDDSGDEDESDDSDEPAANSDEPTVRVVGGDLNDVHRYREHDVDLAPPRRGRSPPPPPPPATPRVEYEVMQFAVNSTYSD